MANLGRLIQTIDELKNNLEQVEYYLNDSNDIVLHEIQKLIGNGNNFVAYRIENSNEFHFAPSRFIGYLNNSLKIHFASKHAIDGKDTTREINKIFHKTCVYDNKLEKEYLSFCSKIGAKPKNMRDIHRKYWLLKDVDIKLYEGGVQQVSLNKYERNPAARQRCIEKFGTSCYVCGLNFGTLYGKIGVGFIHVHHIIPLSQQKDVHVVDEANLIPVCPNCHAMLHRGNVSVEDLQEIIHQNKS